MCLVHANTGPRSRIRTRRGRIDSLKSNEHDREVGSVANDISRPDRRLPDRIRRDGRRQELGVTAALRTVMQMSEIHKPAPTADCRENAGTGATAETGSSDCRCGITKLLESCSGVSEQKARPALHCATAASVRSGQPKRRVRRPKRNAGRRRRPYEGMSPTTKRRICRPVPGVSGQKARPALRREVQQPQPPNGQQQWPGRPGLSPHM